MPDKLTLDEIMERRKGAVIDTERGAGLVKVFAAPPSFKKGEDGQRSATFVMSTESEDRYGDIVVQSGLDLTWFNKNPIALWMHRHAADPLGQWSDVKMVNGRPKRTEGTLDFAPEGAFDEVDKVAKYVEFGIYRACSIGFMPKDYEWIKDDDGKMTWGIKFAESELLECSVVAVGANQEALVKAAGIDKAFVVDVIEDVLDNWCKTEEGFIVPRAQFEDVYKTVKAVPEGKNAPDLREHAINVDPLPQNDKSTGTMTFDIDTSAAEQKLTGLSKLMDDVIGKAKQITGFSSPTEKIEPTVDPAPTDEEPEPEFVAGGAAAARAKAAAAAATAQAVLTAD